MAKSQIRDKWTQRLKRDVEAFQAGTGMKFTTIGNKGIGNARFWERFTAGGTITIEKADELYEFMASHGHHFNS